MPRYRWVALAVGWTSSIMVFLARVSIGPLAPFLKDSFSLSSAQIGALVSAAAMLHAPSLILGGWLADRLGVRRMLMTGTAIISLCGLALFFAPSYQFMYVVMLASGLGTGCIPPAAIKAIVQWFPPKERATAIGLNQTAINFGDILGASVLPSIAIALGWRYGYLFVFTGALTICILGALLYRRPPDLSSIGATVAPLRQLAFGPAILRLFKNRDIWILGASGLFFAIIEFAVTTHLVLYLKEGLAFTAVAAGGILAMAEVGGAMGKPGSGLISDRLLKGRRKAVYLMMDAIAAVICLALAFWGDGLGWLLYPVLFLLGGMTIGWGGIYVTLNIELAGKELAGVAIGSGSAIMVLGIIIGPPLFGWIVDTTHSYQTAWLAMAVSAIMSILLALFIREQRKRI